MKRLKRSTTIIFLFAALPLAILLAGCSNSQPYQPQGVVVQTDKPLDYKKTVETQGEILELQEEERERKQRELLELKRQKEIQQRIKSYSE